MKKVILAAFLSIIIIIGFAFNAHSDDRSPKLFISSDKHAKILPNKAIIRFSPSGQLKIKSKTIEYDFKLTEPMLAPEQSITSEANYSQAWRSMTPSKVFEIMKAEEPLMRTYYIEYEGEIEPEKYCSLLKSKYPDIEIAEPVYLDELLYTPNDTYIASQTCLKTIKAITAWDTFQGDTNLVIAITDDGIFQNHPDLFGNIAPNWNEIPENGIDDDGNGYVDDYIGYNFAWNDDGSLPGNTEISFSSHGTHVAGIAAAQTDNLLGVAGVGFKCRFFPIRVSPPMIDGTTYVSYGYKGIIYAANRGFKVLNCSWGSRKPFSGIDQSVIDYAVSKDLAIVASGGNGNNTYELYYPASYYGILAVGEVDEYDNLTYSSSIGKSIRILAQGVNNWSTDSQIGYRLLNLGGTSYAAPVVSGALALVRAKFPQLDAIQSQELLRVTGDDISGLSSSYAKILPRRVNVLNALNADLNNLVAISPVSHTIGKVPGANDERFIIDDTVYLGVKVKNHLAKATSLRFILSKSNDNLNRITILDSIINVSSIEAGDFADLHYFKFRVNLIGYEPVILRVDISSSTGYRDFFLFHFTPTPEVTTFSNDAISFSVGDYGTLGFGGAEGNRSGVGFNYKAMGNMIYIAGFVEVQDSTHVSSSVYGLGNNNSDFSVIKPFTGIENHRGIIRDDADVSEDHIGIDVEQAFFLPKGNATVAKVIVKITNTSGNTLPNLAGAYYIDWDIGWRQIMNKSSYFPAAIPSGFPIKRTAAQMIYGLDDFPYGGCAVFSNEITAEAQSSAFESGTLDGYRMAYLLKQGVAEQTNATDDLATLTGMRFPEPTAPGESHTFLMCFGAADDSLSLAEGLRACLESGFSPVEETVHGELDFEISPNPANDFCKLTIHNASSKQIFISLRDLLGNVVIERTAENIFATNYESTIDLSSLTSGVYLAYIRCGNSIFNKKINVVK